MQETPNGLAIVVSKIRDNKFKQFVFVKFKRPPENKPGNWDNVCWAGKNIFYSYKYIYS